MVTNAHTSRMAHNGYNDYIGYVGYNDYIGATHQIDRLTTKL